MINYDEVTIEDCLEQFEYKNRTVVINDGKVMGFLKDEVRETA